MEFSPKAYLPLLSEKDYPREIRAVRAALEKLGHTGVCRSFDGCRLAYVHYPAEHSRGSVVIVHGFTEFYKKYCELAWYFLLMGYSVFLYDQRGHGHSSRYTDNPAVVHVHRFSDYSKDLDCFLRNVVLPAAPEAPVYLLGHSMGGAVVLQYLMNGGNAARKAVLSSPMLCPRTGSAPAPLLKTALPLKALRRGWTAPYRSGGSVFRPDAPFPSRSDESYVRFRENLELRIEDPRYQMATGSVRWLHEALHVQDCLRQTEQLAAIRTPVLMILAGRDTVVHEAPQRRLARLLPDCTLVTMPKAKHAIYTGTNATLEPYCGLLFRFLSGDLPKETPGSGSSKG